MGCKNRKKRKIVKFINNGYHGDRFCHASYKVGPPIGMSFVV